MDSTRQTPGRLKSGDHYNYWDIMLEDKVKIIYIESPINQVSEELLSSTKNNHHQAIPQQSPSHPSSIGTRLTSNLRKIQAIENQHYSGKKNLHFKTLKNNLVTPLDNRLTYDLNQEHSRSRQKEYIKYSTPSRRSESVDRGGTFMGGKFGSQLRSGGKKAGSSNKGSLENCLKELKQIKRTIKDLKETCQNGWGTERKLQVLNSNSTPYRKEKSKEMVRGGGKGSANSLSKYSYSNYKYFSSDRPNRSQDRLHESERKFNWMKNEKIQEFSIDASGEELQ